MWQFRSLIEFDSSGGTVTLVDPTARHLKYKDDIVLIPQPSDDVNDPLNWPQYKKSLCFSPIIVFTFMGNWSLAGLSAALLLLIKEFDRDLNTTAQGIIGFGVLALGAGNFFWVPTALYIGKRPSFLVAACLFFGSLIWAAKATSFNSLVAARVVSHFAASCTEGLATAINADLFFLHERGKWMGFYILGLALGPALGSLISGFVVQSLGWRWHLWLCSIVAGVNLLAIFFFFPETQYYRGKYDVPDSGEKSEAVNDTADEISAGNSRDPPSNVKKSLVQELKPWSKINPDASYFHLLVRPFPLIVYPAIFFAFLAFSTTLAWVVCYVDTAAAVYQAPPYLMNIGVSGLYFAPAIIGIFIGAYVGGGLTDLIAEKMARRNNGIFEPESRLVALIFPFFLEPVGLLMYGFGSQRLESWAVGFIGYGFLAFCLTVIPSVTMTYVIDCYYPVAFEALLLVCGLKNIFAFGFSYGVVPWITRSGYEGAFGEMVAIQCGVMLLALPLWYYGKKLRLISAQWKVISW